MYVVMKIKRPTNSKYKYPRDIEAFQDQNENSFYWAGFLAADGGVRKNTVRLCLSSKDEKHIQKFIKFLRTTVPIRNYSKVSNFAPAKGITEPPMLHYSLMYLTSKEIVESLKTYNIVQNKTKIYSIPDVVIFSDHLRHFIRGYFDGDGHFCVDKNNCISWGICGTYMFVNQIRFLLNTLCGFPPEAGNFCKQKNIYRLAYTKREYVWKISKFLWNDSSIFLDRKQKIAQTVFKNFQLYTDNLINEQEVIRLYKIHNSSRTVAKLIGCSGPTIVKICKKHNIFCNKIQRGKNISESKKINIDYDKLNILYSDYKKTYSNKQCCKFISKEFDCSLDTVKSYLQQYNLYDTNNVSKFSKYKPNSS